MALGAQGPTPHTEVPWPSDYITLSYLRHGSLCFALPLPCCSIVQNMSSPQHTAALFYLQHVFAALPFHGQLKLSPAQLMPVQALSTAAVYIMFT